MSQVRALAEIVNSGIQPIQNLPVMNKVGADKKVEWAKFWIEKGFKGITRYVTFLLFMSQYINIVQDS